MQKSYYIFCDIQISLSFSYLGICHTEIFSVEDDIANTEYFQHSGPDNLRLSGATSSSSIFPPRAEYSPELTVDTTE